MRFHLNLKKTEYLSRYLECGLTPLFSNSLPSPCTFMGKTCMSSTTDTGLGHMICFVLTGGGICFPAPDFGRSHVTCISQWDVSRQDTSRGLEHIHPTGLILLSLFWHQKNSFSGQLLFLQPEPRKEHVGSRQELNPESGAMASHVCTFH